MAGYVSIYAGSNTATVPNTNKANPFAGDFKPGQYSAKNQQGSSVLAKLKAAHPDAYATKPLNGQTYAQYENPNTPATASSPKKQSLFSKVSSVAKNVGNSAIAGEKTFATGISRSLPGGTNDLKANEQASEQAVDNIKQTQSLMKSGKINANAGKKIILSSANDAASAAKNTNNIVKSLPSSKRVALGAASTGADIITAGTLPEIKALEGASLTSKVIRWAQKSSEFGTAGALNTAAAGGNKKQVAENFAAGAALPGILKVAAKAGSKVADHVTGGQTTKDFIANAKTRSLMDKTRPVKVANADVETAKSVNTIMSKVHTPKSVIDKAQAASDAQAATQAEAEKAATETQKTVEANKKLDNQIELTNAKKADGKFTNVDKVKIKQLEAQKVPVGDENVNRPNVPEVFKPAKNTVQMSPDEYLQRSFQATDGRLGGNYDSWLKANLKPENVNKYASDMQKGDKFEAPSINEATGSQDGIHRALAAKSLGHDTIPVQITPALSDAENLVQMRKDLATTTSSYQKNRLQNGIKSLEAKVTQPTQGAKVVDTAAIKSQIDKLKGHEDSYDDNGYIKPEVAKQIQGLSKQLNVAGERIPQAERPVTSTPIEPKANELTTPEIKTSKLASRVETMAIKKNLASSFADKPEYAKVNMQKQAETATNLLKTDPERLQRIAMGHERPPEGLLPESAWVTAAHNAKKTGNAQALLDLGTKSHLVSEATGMGQRIRALGELDNDSPAVHIKQIADIGNKKFEKKTGQTFSKTITEGVKDVKKEIPAVKARDWASFVEALKC